MMKRLLLLLLALPVMAMGQQRETNEEIRLVEKLYYDRGVYLASDAERAKLDGLVAKMRMDSTLRVHIVGYADKWGGKSVNDRFSYVRAMCISDWMRTHKVKKEQIVFVGEGIDTMAKSDAEARRVEVLQVVAAELKPQPSPQPKPQAKPQPTPKQNQAAEPKSGEIVATQDARAAEPKGEVDPQMQVTPESAPEGAVKCDISLRTNLLYWLTGMMNIGVEWRPAESPLGVALSGGYSPIGGADWAHALGGWYVAPEVRYYIPNHEEWFAGVHLVAQGFNYKLGNEGSQGTMLSGGVMGGYRLVLTDNFDMDFTLGVGYARANYDRYYHVNGVNVLAASDLSKSMFIPIHAGVNLIWKIK